jgi:hypothetical protein
MFGLITVMGIPAAAAAPKNDIVVPPVPANLQVPVGNSVYRVGHAIGTQNYVCLPCPTTSPHMHGIRLRLDVLRAPGDLVRR